MPFVCYHLHHNVSMTLPPFNMIFLGLNYEITTMFYNVSKSFLFFSVMTHKRNKLSSHVCASSRDLLDRFYLLFLFRHVFYSFSRWFFIHIISPDMLDQTNDDNLMQLFLLSALSKQHLKTLWKIIIIIFYSCLLLRREHLFA